MKKIVRYGYGDSFNDLFIDNNTILKKSKNEYGTRKINLEINFYKFIFDNSIVFPIPKLITSSNGLYKMEFLKDTVPLHIYFKNKPENVINSILKEIILKLENIHFFKQHTSSYLTDLHYECITKLENRFSEIKSIIHDVKINTINGLKVLSIENILDNIKTYINNIPIKSYFELIHGDLNFNNILIKPETEEIFFIDPRGYFGSTELFGIKEYDYAKIKFALSGYDNFDMEQESIITNDNGNITFNIDPILSLNVILENNLTTLLMVTLWLGNSHSFKHNKQKCLKSYFYALYLSTLFFSTK
jgi:hypothetical protein